MPKTLPDQVETPETVIEGIEVKISWTKPFGNGADIIKFRVFIKHKNGEYMLDDKNCREDDQTVFLNQHCYISMAELTGPEYQLVKGDLIQAKV